MENGTIATIFEETPASWGLRGDPCLWDEMRRLIGGLPRPVKRKELLTLLENAFEKLTGEDLRIAGNIFIKRFDTGGMSSGYVCGEWWRNTGLPHLVKAWKRS